MLVARGGAQSSSSTPDQKDVIITVEQMLDLKKAGENVIVLDVRKAPDDRMAKDSVQVSPNRAVQEVGTLELPKDAWLIAFCA